MNGSPRSIGRSSGLSSPSAARGPGRQHEVARQRRPIPAEEPDRLGLAQTRPQAGEQSTHAVGGLAGGVLEGGQLVDVVDDPEAVGRVDEQVVGVLDQAARPGQLAQRVDQVGRHLDRRPARVRLPADHADPAARADALAGQDLPERPRPVPGLARQAQVLEQLATHRQGSRAGHPEALVADQDQRLPAGPDDQQRLLETGVEAGQERQVGAVLPIGVHDDPVVAPRVGPAPQLVEPAGVGRGRDDRHRLGHVEVRQRDLAEAWGRHRGPSCAQGVGGCQGRTAVAPRSIVLKPSAGTVSHGPHSPSGHWTRTLAERRDPEADMDPAELARLVAAADIHLAPDRLVADLDLDPGADRIPVRPGLGHLERGPVAHRLRGRGVARPDVPPQLDRIAVVDLDEIEQPVEVEVCQRGAAALGEAQDAGGVGPLDERPVRLAEEEVARVLLGVVGDLVDVALRHEQVDEAIVVHVLELGVPGRRRQLVAAGERLGGVHVALQADVAIGRLRRALRQRLESFSP